MKYFAFLPFFMVFLISSPVFAHETGASVQQNRVPEPAAVEKRFQLALTLVGNEVRLAVKKFDGSPVEIGISSATVFVVTGNKQTWFRLDPNEDEDILAGTGEFISDKNTKFEVTLHLPGEKPINASFTPAVSKAPTAMRQ